MFNINAPEFLVILVIALVVIGPQRLPEYAENLGRWVRQLRDMALGARDTVRQELGPEFDDVDWAKFDPRQYDPRRIVRDALLEPPTPRPVAAADPATPEPAATPEVTEPIVDSDDAVGLVKPRPAGSHPAAAAGESPAVVESGPVVYDDEAT